MRTPSRWSNTSIMYFYAQNRWFQCEMYVGTYLCMYVRCRQSVAHLAETHLGSRAASPKHLTRLASTRTRCLFLLTFSSATSTTSTLLHFYNIYSIPNIYDTSSSSLGILFLFAFRFNWHPIWLAAQSGIAQPAIAQSPAPAPASSPCLSNAKPATLPRPTQRNPRRKAR